MNDNEKAVLKAAHTIETYCMNRICEKCPFQTAPLYCMLEKSPTQWHILELKEEIMKGLAEGDRRENGKN